MAQISPALTRNMLGLSVCFMVGYRKTLNQLSRGSGKAQGQGDRCVVRQEDGELWGFHLRGRMSPGGAGRMGELGLGPHWI